MGTGGTVHRDRGGTQSGATQVAQTRFVSEAEWVPILRMRFCARVADGGASVSLARHYVAGASARCHPLLHSVGSGRTSPPVRRRDPFPACRSTRGVVDGSRTFGNRVPHGSWSSSVGPATVLPLSAGDGGTMRDPIHVASRSFLVSFSCEPYNRPTVSGARGG